MTAPQPRLSTEQDAPSVRELLRQCGLPLDGLEEMEGPLWITEVEGATIACAALEITEGGVGLLRSVAVARDHRQQGVGDCLVHLALHAARERRLTHVYLLTNEASDFFRRHGFECLGHKEAPSAIRGTAEYRSSACRDAKLMVRAIDSYTIPHQALS